MRSATEKGEDGTLCDEERVSVSTAIRSEGRVKGKAMRSTTNDLQKRSDEQLGEEQRLREESWRERRILLVVDYVCCQPQSGKVGDCYCSGLTTLKYVTVPYL